MRDEAEFLEAIDCRFPYGDAASAQALIDEACSISGNAAFMVAHELARPPRSHAGEDPVRLALLDRLDQRLQHPLKDSVLDVARRMVRRESLALEECRALMQRVAAHPGEFNALAIISCSCEEDGMQAIHRIYDSIVDAWRGGHQPQGPASPKALVLTMEGQGTMTPTELRDRAMSFARVDAVAALRLARENPHPWFRAQALAAAARWSDESQIELLAAESLASAEACHDDYQRAAVAAWGIRALLERGRTAAAACALSAARRRALAASPPGSRAEALFTLLQSAWELGPETRCMLVEDLAATHEQDQFWRVSRCLVDALAMMRATEPDRAAQIADRISNDRIKARAVRVLHDRGPCGPRTWFR